MQGEELPRREREKLRQRQDILDAAVKLFSEKGYHNVSMHEIAKKAEFAIGTLYKFFKNKEDLYKALIMGLSEKFHTTLTSAVTKADGEIEKLRNYVKAKKIFVLKVNKNSPQAQYLRALCLSEPGFSGFRDITKR